jgi:RNA polymerase sigma-70 factor (ECF subfamily)
MNNLSDAEIIDSVRKGNRNDFSMLIDRYKNKAYSMLIRMLKNNMEAEEVLQDCFLKAYYGLNSFRQEAKFSTWFYRIVYNTALTKLVGKKRKINAEMGSLDDYSDILVADDYNVSDQTDTGEILSELVQKLPANYAAVINMFYINDMSCEEIASVMNVTTGNVKVILHRSRNALKDLIEKNNLTGELQ